MKTKLLTKIGERFCIQFNDLSKVYAETRCIDTVMSYAVDRYKSMTPKEKLIYYLENGNSVRITGDLDMSFFYYIQLNVLIGKRLGDLLLKSRYNRNTVLVVTDKNQTPKPCSKQVVYFSESQIPFAKHVAF